LKSSTGIDWVTRAAEEVGRGGFGGDGRGVEAVTGGEGGEEDKVLDELRVLEGGGDGRGAGGATGSGSGPGEVTGNGGSSEVGFPLFLFLLDIRL
jgi:hypothetical protein